MASMILPGLSNCLPVIFFLASKQMNMPPILPTNKDEIGYIHLKKDKLGLTAPSDISEDHGGNVEF